MMLKICCAATSIAGTLLLGPIASAATVGTLAGFTQPPGEMPGMIGSLCYAPNICDVIGPEDGYDNMVPDPRSSGGVDALNYWVDATTGEQTVVGYSLGGAVITVWVRDNPNLAAEDLTFITFGNPYIGQMPGTTSYQVTEVVHQYDMAADLPDDWSNLLAWANLLVSDRHCCYTDADLTDPDAVVWVDGNVTYRLIPADTLPIMSLVSWINPDPKYWYDLIEAAYNRPVPVSYPTSEPTPTDPPVDPPVEEPPAPPADKPGNGPKPKRQTTQEVTTSTSTLAVVESVSPGVTATSSTTADATSVATRPVKGTETKRASDPVAPKPKVRESHKAEPKHDAEAPKKRDADTPKAERKAERQAEKADKPKRDERKPK